MGFAPPPDNPPLPPGNFVGVKLKPPVSPPPTNLGLSFGGVFEPPIQIKPLQIGIGGDFTFVLPGIFFCGLSLLPPGIEFSFNLGIRFPPFPFPPNFRFFIALVCSLTNPLSASCGFGGGRPITGDIDMDPDYLADL